VRNKKAIKMEQQHFMERYNSQKHVYLLIDSKIFGDDAISCYQSWKVSSMKDMPGENREITLLDPLADQSKLLEERKKNTLAGRNVISGR